MSRPEHLVPSQNSCGEVPVWDPHTRRVTWSDFGDRLVWSYDVRTGQSWSQATALTIGGWGRRAGGGWIASTEKGIAIWDQEANEFELRADPEHGNPEMRYGDAVVDRDGRFLCGTVYTADRTAARGVLYSYEPNGTVSTLATGFAVPNGLGLSPDGATLYVTDMFHHRIVAYDYDRSTGAVAGKRTFVTVSPEQGYPDGLTVDSAGFVWSCHWAGSCITRYTARGSVDRVLRLPVPNVTCCAFGGADLTDLFITTARKGLSEEEIARYPLSGDLFRVHVDVPGLVEPLFAG